MNLDRQVALVTGASRGIGTAIATELASQGAIVIGTATIEAGAEAISQYLAETREGGGRGMVLDVNDADALQRRSSTKSRRNSAVSPSWSTMPALPRTSWPCA